MKHLIRNITCGGLLAGLLLTTAGAAGSATTHVAQGCASISACCRPS